MKNFFSLIAFWFIGIITVFGGTEIYKIYQGSEFDKKALPYIEQVVPEISKWDPIATKSLMSPEIAATIPDDKYARAMIFFSQLGALQGMGSPDFEKAHVDQETGIGKHTIVEYKVQAKYENGDAEINLKLLQREGNFEIYRFNFSSESLLPK